MLRPDGLRRALLWGIVGIAIAVRLPSLLHDGLWRDEAYVYVDLIAPTLHEFLHRVAETEWHPPLFFLIEYAWVKLAGIGTMQLSILPFAIAIATVPVTYLLGRDADSPAAGVLAAAIYALAPVAVVYSDEYVYPFAAFAFALLAWAVVRARREPMTLSRWAGVAAASALATYAHYTALFYVPMLMAWSFFSGRSLRERIALAAALAAGAATFAAWLAVFLHQRAIGLPYEGGSSAGAKISFFVATALEYVPARPAVLQLWAAVALAAAAAIVARARNASAAGVALGAFFVVSTAIACADDLLAIRYVAPLYPLLCVFFASMLVRAAAAISRASPAAVRFALGAVAAAACALVAAGDVAFALQNPSVPKSGFRTLARSRGFDRDTLYVVAPDYMASTFAFYARGSGAALRGFVRYDHPEVFRLENYARDWNRPDAVARALSAIAADVRGKRCLAYAIDGFARDQARVPYGKSWQLLAALRERYPLAGRAIYPGRYEPVEVYRFATAPVSGAAAAICR
ncbi:MAG TPA: glycosyltransferase family 39 protein [Candidatus Acidoferrales bacterium]|nr:glycosyltransferase family 39 protein [Candidatus Acidoferrales bacterium]